TTTGACVAGNCHHDSDCVAPNYTGGNGVCVNFACAGNCRSNADCAASGASAYCSPSTHQCGPCSATSQCSSGQVCTASSGGSCVPGTCSFDVACNASAGQSCVNNACAQTAPGTAATLPGGGSPVSSTEATSCLNCFPNVLSGNLGLYYSWSPNSSTVYQQQVALDASDLKHVRWRLQEGTNGRTDFPGFVLTGAQGLPMSSSGTPNDVFFTSDYYNFYAHLGSDGTLLWKSTQPWYGPGAMGIAGTGTSAVPTMAFFPQTYALAYLVRADTGAYRTVNLGSCSQLGTPVWGKFYAYYFCAEGIQAVDPVANIVRWKVPFPGGNAGSGGGNVANLAIWRAPGATQETLYFAASVNSSTSHMWSLTVTDAMTATYAAPTGYVMGAAVTPSANYQGSYVATLLDANDLAGGQPPRVVFAGLNGATSVTDGAGNLLAQVNLPVGGNAKISLAGDGTILGVTGANMVGLQIVPNPVAPTSSQVITKWSLPLNPSGQWQTFSYPTAVATPGATFGYLLEWGQPSTVSTPLLQEMSPPTGGQSFLASAPAWSWYGGDTGGHRMAPSYECVADADCPSPQACVLNRCIGQCRTGADCGQNLGCIMGQCEACFTDASCDTTRGQRCNAGLCYDPPASGTSCSKSTDCLAGQSCLHAACVPSPGLSTNAQSTVSFTPQAVYLQDTHGFDYSVWNGGGNLTVKAWDPATFDPPAPWLATTSSFSSLAITNAAPSGALQPFPVGVSLRPDRDTFFFTGGITSQNLYTYDGLPVGNGTTSTSHTAFDGRNSSTYQLWGALTQGMSKAGDGVTNKPALFSYSNGVVFAMDAMAASIGTGPLTLLWSGNTGGSDQFNNQPVPLLVGSDGTVYHFRANGNVQAWSPDGDPQGTIVGGTKAGKLLWTFSPANLVPPQNTWTNNVGYRPAIMNFGGATDTIFFCTNVANTLAMVDVNAGGFSNYLQTGATCNTNNATILVDTDGTVILATSNNLQLIAGKD
ncbi:MAG: hypothetical protein JST92_06880, partial [Deltaproteobacteria bacterium]|nr:hypothetical protein [Deltaproteobacteria bacterium]